MWSSTCEAVCRRHPELVAVYASPDGRLALLLQHTVMPSSVERGRWFAETRRAGRAISTELQAAGAGGAITLLQWRSLPEIARIMRRWRCQYESDPDRRMALAKLVTAGSSTPATRHLWTTGGQALAPASDTRATSLDLVTPVVLEWYRDMMPSWLGIEPRVRRLLVLETHRWTVDRALAPIASGEPPAHADLTMDGDLASRLRRLVPRAERDQWAGWIDLTLRDLRRALTWSPERRSTAWVRWLFLIPYSVPVSRSSRANSSSHRLTVVRPPTTLLTRRA